MSTGDIPGPWLPSPSPDPRLLAVGDAFTRLGTAARRAAASLAVLAVLERRGTRGPRPVRPKQQRRPDAVRPLPPHGR